MLKQGKELFEIGFVPRFLFFTFAAGRKHARVDRRR
jgi:hypothetical protein